MWLHLLNIWFLIINQVSPFWQMVVAFYSQVLLSLVRLTLACCAVTVDPKISLYSPSTSRSNKTHYHISFVIFLISTVSAVMNIFFTSFIVSLIEMTVMFHKKYIYITLGLIQHILTQILIVSWYMELYIFLVFFFVFVWNLFNYSMTRLHWSILGPSNTPLFYMYLTYHRKAQVHVHTVCM